MGKSEQISALRGLRKTSSKPPVRRLRLILIDAGDERHHFEARNARHFANGELYDGEDVQADLNECTLRLDPLVIFVLDSHRT